MTAEEVCKRLMAWGIEAERRSIYDDVKEINYASWLLAHRGKGKSLDDAVEAIENDKYGNYKLIAKNPKKGFYVQPRQYSYQEIRLLAESVSMVREAGVTVRVPGAVVTLVKLPVTSTPFSLNMWYSKLFGLLPTSVWLPDAVASAVKPSGRPFTVTPVLVSGAPS